MLPRITARPRFPIVTTELCFRRMAGTAFPMFLVAFFLVLPRAVWPQSTDDVHVVPPRQGKPASQVDVPDGLDHNAHMKHIRADVDLVQVPVTVTDALNRTVLDLQKENFTLYEDDRPQTIRFFSKEDAPISVGIILDFSESMSNKFDTERAAVAAFFNNANPNDDYFAIAFSDRPKLIADSTQSITDLEDKLMLAVPAGNTALLDAIYMGVSKMRSARYQRRALLIISDGGDNHSYYNTKETKTLVEEADVVMYSIGIFDGMPVPVFKTIEEKLGKRLLTDITELTGGRTIAADNRDKVPQIAATVSRELRQEYILAYRSDRTLHDGKWRKIKVQVMPAAGSEPLHVHYKKGYIAPTD